MAVLLKTYLPDILLLSNNNGATVEVKKLVASDGKTLKEFGESCAMSGDLVVISAEGFDEDDNDDAAVYLFNLYGTEKAKLIPGKDGEKGNWFGVSVSMDEKVVVATPTGSWGGYIRVFSRFGNYGRTIRCDDCTEFGKRVATLGNLIVTSGEQNDTNKLFIYGTDGELLKTLDQGSEIFDVAISEQVIVATVLGGKTLIFSNSSPDFPQIGCRELLLLFSSFHLYKIIHIYIDSFFLHNICISQDFVLPL